MGEAVPALSRMRRSSLRSVGGGSPGRAEESRAPGAGGTLGRPGAPRRAGRRARAEIYGHSRPPVHRARPVSVFSAPNSGVEDPTRAGGRGQGRRRSPEAPRSTRRGRAWRFSPALLAMCPGSCSLWDCSVVSSALLEDQNHSRLGWPNLGSAPNCGPFNRSKEMASMAVSGAASPGFGGARAGSSLAAGPGPEKWPLKDTAHSGSHVWRTRAPHTERLVWCAT